MSDVRCLNFDIIQRGLKISFLLLFASLLSCGEEQIDPPGNPADKQHIGTWSGTTNEGLPVTFYIDTIDDWTWVSRFVINFYRDTVNSQVLDNIAGIAKVEGGGFVIGLGNGDLLQGKFTGDNLLAGSMNIDSNVRSFSCTNEDKEINLNSICQSRFHFKQNNYLIRQGHRNIIVKHEEHLTYYHRKYFKSSLKLKYPYPDSIRLIKITKGRLTDIWNEGTFVQFFTPGKRNYSVGGRNGIEISIYDTLDIIQKYSTSYGGANQQGSTFEITEVQKLENGLNGRVTIKLTARFDCMMYDIQGQAEPLTNGIFIGLFEQELEK